MKRILIGFLITFAIILILPNLSQAQQTSDIDAQIEPGSPTMIITTVAIGLAGTVFGVGSFEVFDLMGDMSFGFGARLPIGMIFGYQTSYGLENKFYFITPVFTAPDGKYYKRIELYYKLSVSPFEAFNHRLMLRGILPINLNFYPERPEAHKTGFSIQPLIEVGIYMQSLSDPVRFNAGAGVLVQIGLFTIGAVGSYVIADPNSLLNISLELAYYF
jgi:hypothetical protein